MDIIDGIVRDTIPPVIRDSIPALIFMKQEPDPLYEVAESNKALANKLLALRREDLSAQLKIHQLLRAALESMEN